MQASPVVTTTLPSQYVITTDDVARSAPRGQRAPHEPGRADLTAAIGRLSLRVLECRSVEQAAKTAAAGLVELAGGGRVAIGLARPQGDACRLSALSSVPSVDLRSDRSHALQAALDEVLLNDAPTVLDADNDTPAPKQQLPLKAHEHLARITGSRAVLGVPLSCGDRVVAVLLWYDEGRRQELARVQDVLELSGELLGPSLQAVVRAERSAVGRVCDRSRELLHGERRRYAGIAAAVLFCALMVPSPYRVSCTARLEPVARRYVVAPFEAVLENTLVRPGDVVDKNEGVARLDGREVRWKLASVEAKLAQAVKRYDAALAELKPSEAELARLEAEQLRLERRQLQRHQEQLQIRSPIRGVVLSGELERAEGAALTTGQTLLEIAPLDEFLVEIEVPDDQLRFVEVGRSISLKLDAFPGRKWKGQVQRVRPLGEIRDQKNVFIAEVRLENRDGELRPGMKGRAKITGPIRPVGWILFHRPYEAVRQWIGW